MLKDYQKSIDTVFGNIKNELEKNKDYIKKHEQASKHPLLNRQASRQASEQTSTEQTGEQTGE